ncbi:hypothetical protein DMI62_20515 [Escherichia coli]|nr:hypothetical protein [Escherichia coli]
MRAGEFDSRQRYERQGQYQQAEEDFWRAVWSGNSKAGGYYGLARLAARNGNFDTGLDFLPTKSSRLPNQSGSALPA